MNYAPLRFCRFQLHRFFSRLIIKFTLRAAVHLIIQVLTLIMTLLPLVRIRGYILHITKRKLMEKDKWSLFGSQLAVDPMIIFVILFPFWYIGLVQFPWFLRGLTTGDSYAVMITIRRLVVYEPALIAAFDFFWVGIQNNQRLDRWYPSPSANGFRWYTPYLIFSKNLKIQIRILLHRDR